MNNGSNKNFKFAKMVKHLQRICKRIWDTVHFWLPFLLIALFIATLLRYFCLLGIYVPIAWDGNISLKDSADIGTFVNGIFGTLSAFLGVILFYFSLMLQKKELNEQRKEFQTSRYTTIIYNQLNQINLITNEFYYGSQKGLYAFYTLNKYLHDTNSDMVILKLSENLINFMQAFTTFCKPVISIIESTEQNDKKELANLFYSNIDAKIIESIKAISEIKVKEESDTPKEPESSKNNELEKEKRNPLMEIIDKAEDTYKSIVVLENYLN